MKYTKKYRKRWERLAKKQQLRTGHHDPRPAETTSRAFIYQSEMEFIFRCILDYPSIETGGELFGFWSASGTPVVLYAIGPGPHANHQPTFFNQDLDYLHSLGGLLVRRYGLHHIGEWHSHHQLGLAQPSGHDARTMIENIRNHHLHRFLCCIGNCREEAVTLNPFNFTESAQYTRADWVIKPMESPFRQVIDSQLGGQVIQPRAQYSLDLNI